MNIMHFYNKLHIFLKKKKQKKRKEKKRKREVNVFFFMKFDQMSRVGSRDCHAGWRSKKDKTSIHLGNGLISWNLRVVLMYRGMKIQLSQKQIEITIRILECQFCQTTEGKMKWAKNEIVILQ